MSDKKTSFSWTHSAPSDETMLIVQCPCGIAHEVHRALDGGMSVVDCPCGMQIVVDHPTSDDQPRG